MHSACRPASVALGTDPTPIHVTTARTAAAASNRFGFDLYAKLRVAEENLIMSPIGASMALAMTAAGARGETLAEMSRVLHVDTLADAHAAFADLLASLPNGEPRAALVDPRFGNAYVAQLRLADRVWVDKSFRCRNDFLSLLRERYRVSLGQVDFVGAPEAARAEINAWVGKETQERIPDLLGPNSIRSDTRLVLVDGVYFKALWARPFAAVRTQDQDFATGKGRVRTKMMRQKTDWGEVRHARIDNLQLVELPYIGQLSMIVFLPDDADGLVDVENRIARSYDRWVAALTAQVVDLWLPRWTTTQAYSLDAALQSLGMSRAFSRSADFSGMTDRSNQSWFFIDHVIQRSFVQSDETGTEAAAATAVVMMEFVSGENGIPPPTPVVFHAVHPFMYVIRERQSGAILFVGRVVDPR